MLLQMRNVFQELSFVAKGDVVEQDQVLMDLAHVADVGYHGQAEFPGEQTDGDKFRNTGKAGAIGLNDMHGSGLHEIVEQNAIGDMLAESNAGRGNGFGELLVGGDVIGVSRLFNEVRGDRVELAAYLERSRQCPLLIGVEQESNACGQSPV